MISLFEKIQYGLSGLVILLVALLYFVLGGFETDSRDLLTVIREDTPRRTKVAEAQQRRLVPPPPRENTAELREVEQKLVQQGLDRNLAKQIKTESYKIPDDVYDFIKKPRNWMPELKKASSEPVFDRDGRPTKLKLYDIEEGSFFEKFGLENGDEVSLIDKGLNIFDAARTSDFHQLATRMFAQLESGNPISVTVLRNGRPVHLKYRKQ